MVHLAEHTLNYSKYSLNEDEGQHGVNRRQPVATSTSLHNILILNVYVSWLKRRVNAQETRDGCRKIDLILLIGRHHDRVG